MNREEIRRQIVEYVKDQVGKGLEKRKAEYNLYSYCTLSHNLYQFLPSVSGDEHWDIYKNILACKALSANTDYFHTFDYEHILRNVTKETLRPYLPCIIACFHFCDRTGYFMPLIRENINFAIITGYEGEVLQKKLEEVTGEIEFTKKFFPGSTTKVELISYKSKSLFIDLLRKIKERCSIMWFQDWADKYVNPEECVPVSFLNHQILVPKGMAVFSYVTKRPIVPWFAFYSKDMQSECRLGDIIKPQSMTQEEYIKYVPQELYGQLENNVRSHYQDWEGWFNIHRFTTGESAPVNTKPVSPAVSFKDLHISKTSSMFKIGNESFIMNRKSGKLIEIDDRIIKIISERRLSDLTEKECEILCRDEILVE